MATPQNVEVNVQGNFSGNLVVGNHNIVVNNPNGGVVNVTAPPPPAEPRARPVNLRPRNFPGLLDRDPEMEALVNAVQSSMHVTLFGESGMGKTALLRKAAHQLSADGFADGVIYLNVREMARDDLLQSIYDAFYTSPANHKPTDGELRTKLNGIHGLIFLDDLTLSREDVESILDALPHSFFVLASTERVLWGEGQTISLDGLPEAEGVELFQRELGRNLSEDEKPIAGQICKMLLFHPLRILQTASMIREDGLSLPQAFQKLTTTRTQWPTVEMAVQKSNDTQKKIFSVLAVAGGFALTRDHMAKLIGSASFDVELKSLVQRGMVQEAGSSLSLSGDAAAALMRLWNLSSWEDALIQHFANWLSTAPQDVLVDQASDLLFHLLKQAGEKKQWPQLVKLGTALERISILQKKWQRWVQILDLLRMAARALADKKLEGWVLHQMGTRSMCLDMKPEAQEFLKQALDVRRAIGDRAGVEVTQHNLNVLLNLPVPPAKVVRSRMGNLQRWLLIGAAGGGAGIILLVLLVGGYYFLNPFSPPEETPILLTNTESPIPPTLTLFPTETPISPTVPRPTHTPSRSPTRTPTPTPTATLRPVALYDFIANADKAIWEAVDYYGMFDEISYYDFEFNTTTDASPSYKEIMDGYPSAYVGWERNPELEDQSKESLVVLAFPNPKYAPSYINGYYDLRTITLQKGDVFRARVGYIYPYESLPSALIYDVKFEVYFSDDLEFPVLLGEVSDFLDGKTQELNIPIPPDLYGRRGFFILKVFSGDNGAFDWSAWLDAVLIGLPR